MDRSTGDAVTAAGIDGVFVVAEPRRAYPAGPLLGPVLGFTGVATPQDVERWPDLPPGEVVGRAGLEQQYDAVLRGINGQQCLYVDPKGVPVALGERQDPVPGADLRLSIDLGLQQQLDTSLAAAVRAQPRPRGRIGAAVAMDPRSGQILAMASTPSFDNNIYGPPVDAGALQGLAAAPGSPMLEHVTQAVAPPGSTFKLVVAAANQAHPVFAPSRAIPTGADFTYGGHTFGNWKPMGPMNMVQSTRHLQRRLLLQARRRPRAGRDDRHGPGARRGRADRDRPPGRVHRVPRHTGVRPGGRRHVVRRVHGHPRHRPGLSTGHTAAERPLDRRRRHREPGHPAARSWRSGRGRARTRRFPLPGATPVPFAAALGPVREGMRAAVTGGTAVRLADLPAPVGAKTGTAQDGGLPDGELRQLDDVPPLRSTIPRSW